MVIAMLLLCSFKI